MLFAILYKIHIPVVVLPLNKSVSATGMQDFMSMSVILIGLSKVNKL